MKRSLLGVAASLLCLSAPAEAQYAPHASEGDVAAVSSEEARATEESATAEASPREKLSRALRPVGPNSRVFEVGGYIQPSFEYTADTDFNPNDFDGFNFRATRLFARSYYEVAPEKLSVGARVELDFAQGNAIIKDLFGSVGLFKDRIFIDLGQAKMAFSQFLLAGDGVRQFALPRPVEPNIGRLAATRDRGARVRLSLPLGRAHLNWFASVTNGGGENVNRNQDSKFIYATFAEVAPLGAITLNEADLDRSPLRFAAGGSFGYTPSIESSTFGNPGVDNKEVRYALHARLVYRGLSARGEYLSVKQGAPGDGSPGPLRKGWYAQAGYILPWLEWPAIELVARVQQFDLDGTRDGFEDTAATGLVNYDVTGTRRFEVGVNLYVLDHRFKAQLTYRVTQLTEGLPKDTAGNRLIGDSIFLTVQFGAF